jgi:hypothetical protein
MKLFLSQSKGIGIPAMKDPFLDSSYRSRRIQFDLCEGDEFNDGYPNLLENPTFIAGEDPEVILVSGRIHKSGEVSLNPFVYLPSANLDLAPGKEGEYYFELYDEAGELLSRTGSMRPSSSWGRIISSG